jgi:hypothetical protein
MVNETRNFMPPKFSVKGVALWLVIALGCWSGYTSYASTSDCSGNGWEDQVFLPEYIPCPSGTPSHCLQSATTYPRYLDCSGTGPYTYVDPPPMGQLTVVTGGYCKTDGTCHPPDTTTHPDYPTPMCTALC